MQGSENRRSDGRTCSGSSRSHVSAAISAIVDRYATTTMTMHFAEIRHAVRITLPFAMQESRWDHVRQSGYNVMRIRIRTDSVRNLASGSYYGSGCSSEFAEVRN